MPPKNWVVRERRPCSSDGTPIPMTLSRYIVFNENEHETYNVSDLKTALLIAAAPNLLNYLRRIIAGEESAIKEAAQYIQDIPEKHI